MKFDKKQAYFKDSRAFFAYTSVKSRFTLGRELSVKQIEIISKIAVKHGFKLAGFRSFKKAITPSEIAIIKEKAALRFNEARRNKVIS